MGVRFVLDGLVFISCFSFVGIVIVISSFGNLVCFVANFVTSFIAYCANIIVNVVNYFNNITCLGCYIVCFINGKGYITFYCFRFVGAFEYSSVASFVTIKQTCIAFVLFA